MTSSDTYEQHFRASVDVEKTIVIHTDDTTSNNNTEDYSEHTFVIDISEQINQVQYVNCILIQR